MRIVLLVVPSFATAIAAWYYFRGPRPLRPESELPPTSRLGNGEARGGIEATAPPLILEPALTLPSIAPSTYVEHPQQAVEDKKAAIDTTATQETSPPPVRETGITAIERGGRPRGPRSRSSLGEARTRTAPVGLPEIVCWRRGRQWILGIEIPEELIESGDVEASQGGRPLVRDENRENCWWLEELRTEVVVRWQDDSSLRSITLLFADTGYLVFKCSGDGRHGRRVRSPSRGMHLVVAPAAWRTDESSSLPLAAPERTSLSAYDAHLFAVTGEGEILFLNSDMQRISVTATPGFQVVGTQLPDASEHVGALFGHEPPRLRAPTATAWQDVKTIIIGQEGGGRQRWRTEVRPVEGQVEQDLSEALSTRSGGWYFLRIYDVAEELLDSLDFRFVRALRKIKLPDLSLLPSEEGHERVEIEFLHEPECLVSPDAKTSPKLDIRRESLRTIITLMPKAETDETGWLVTLQDGPDVKATVVLRRLWWGASDEWDQPSTWTDRPLDLTATDFAATASRALWFRLLHPQRVDEVLVGFDNSHARRVRLDGPAGAYAIALRNFADADGLRMPGPATLSVWLPDEASPPVVVAHVRIRLVCQRCGFTTDGDETGIAAHIEAHHLEELFRVLTYQETYAEMRDRLPSLPPGIYKCHYCRFYVASNDPMNPTSAIIRHIERDCPSVVRGEAPLTILFRTIHEVDEVREAIAVEVPTVYECTLCLMRMRNATPSDRLDHVLAAHRRQLYGYC